MTARAPWDWSNRPDSSTLGEGTTSEKQEQGLNVPVEPAERYEESLEAFEAHCAGALRSRDPQEVLYGKAGTDLIARLKRAKKRGNANAIEQLSQQLGALRRDWRIKDRVEPDFASRIAARAGRRRSGLRTSLRHFDGDDLLRQVRDWQREHPGTTQRRAIIAIAGDDERAFKAVNRAKKREGKRQHLKPTD